MDQRWCGQRIVLCVERASFPLCFSVSHVSASGVCVCACVECLVFGVLDGITLVSQGCSLDPIIDPDQIQYGLYTCSVHAALPSYSSMIMCMYLYTCVSNPEQPKT